ncbi:MAG: hypothetical protein EON52_22670 [Actinomycetales bacterium]|nr:MAG: hypothetical protein EON52_22670 [Actinomycetales bacterium]
MRLAALLLTGALALSGCTSDDDSPEPTVTQTTPSGDSPSTSTSASAPGQGQGDVDDAVTSAISSQDTSGLRNALREAGQADGEAAADGPRELTADADVRRNYRVAGWWLDRYRSESDFSGLFDEGTLRPYAEVVQDSASLSALATLADRVENDWQDETGKRLSLNDTYDAAFDEAAGR